MVQLSLTTMTLDPNELAELLAAGNERQISERRAEPRHPFFATVALTTVENSSKSLSLFSREISSSGIGLLHSMSFDKDVIGKLTIESNGRRVAQLAQMVWCRPAGEGWYLSGWRFIALA
jgi:hypothetical protein